MPRRTSGQKRPDDPNRLAKTIVHQATGQTAPLPEDTIRAVMREMGRRGGLKGGKARAEKLTGKRRRAIASQAAKTRWKTKKP